MTDAPNELLIRSQRFTEPIVLGTIEAVLVEERFVFRWTKAATIFSSWLGLIIFTALAIWAASSAFKNELRAPFDWLALLFSIAISLSIIIKWKNRGKQLELFSLDSASNQLVVTGNREILDIAKITEFYNWEERSGSEQSYTVLAFYENTKAVIWEGNSFEGGELIAKILGFLCDKPILNRDIKGNIRPIENNF